MINKASSFIKDNLLKIIIGLFAVLGFYLDNTYVSTAKHSKVQRELDTLKVKFRMYVESAKKEDIAEDKDFKRLEDRFDKKIKILNSHTKEIDDNENNIIRLQETHKK